MCLVAQEAGVDLSYHRARRIEAVPGLADFDLILAMERGQVEALQVEFPPSANTFTCLAPWPARLTTYRIRLAVRSTNSAIRGEKSTV